ncbi:MAG: ligand-binding sensor domain-containing protein, partial [Thermoflexibacteraceae bacterium]
MQKLLYTLLFFLFTLSAINAQNLKFWHLTIRERLSNNSINCLLQDSKGFMWIGTSDGLNRYDGYKFDIYLHNPKDKYTLSNNFVNALYEDKKQNIWIGTQSGGLCKYDRKYNRITQVEEIRNVIVSAFVEEGDKLWVAAQDRLFYFDSPSNKFLAYPEFTKSTIMTMDLLNNNMLLVGTTDAGVYSIDTKTGKIQQFLHKEEEKNSLCYNRITSIYKDIKGNVWIGTEKGLDRFDAETSTFNHFLVDKNPKNSPLVNSFKQITGHGKEVFFATENG